MAKKIALFGSAPSSVRLGPHADPSWEFYVCSPGAYPNVSPTRVNAWFEIHRWEPPWGYTGEKNWFTKDYIAWMAQLKCPVYMQHPVKEIPTSVAFPKDAMIEKFGWSVWGSSLSWMFAMAICAGATEISLWGVDMSATEEWGKQRKDCQHFVEYARAMGIAVHVPPESDLLMPGPLYGFCEADPMHIKLTVRKRELESQINALNADIQAKTVRAHQLCGALGELIYAMETWINDPLALRLAHANPVPNPSVTAAILKDAEASELPKPNGHHVEQEHGVQAQA